MSGPGSRPFLTATLIVRDEAVSLPRCLASIRGLVDEIVVVDTGSTDDSPRIAAELGARVVSFPWCGDFAAARNAALDHARGHWVLYVDADEVASGLDRAALAAHLDDPGLVGTTVRFRSRSGFTRYHEYRLFRRDPRIRFRHVIHETFVPDLHAVAGAEGLRLGRSELALDHYGYDGDQRAKHLRDVPLLRARLAEDPDHVYSWNHLGRALAGLGDVGGALAAWRRAVSIVRARANPGALDRLPYGSLLLRPEAAAEAPALLREALDHFPDDHLFRWVQGEHLRTAGRLREAIGRLEPLAAIDGDALCSEDGVAYDARIFGLFVHEALGLCHFRLGHYAESARWYARAEAAAPERYDLAVKRRLAESRAVATTPSPAAPGATRDARALDRLLETALTEPSRLTRADLDGVLAAARPDDVTGWDAALAAILHARGDLADEALVDQLTWLLQVPGLTEPSADVAVAALHALAATELGGAVACATVRLLSVEGPAVAVPRLVALLRACADWCPEALDIDTIVALAARPALRAHRDRVLGHVVEPLLVRAPDTATVARIERIRAAFAGGRRLAYTLELLRGRPGIAADVRARIAGWTATGFPVRDAAREYLGRVPFALLVVLNVRVGQGDELVRLAAFLQALLDDRPSLVVTLVTSRQHLYDHPQVRTVAILDDGALDRVLARRYDGVFHVSERGCPEVAWSPSLDARVQALVERQRPGLVVTADVGHNHFDYRSVVLAGREIPSARDPDQHLLESIYDAGRRLLAELGRPVRVAEEPPRPPDLLTGTASADAARAWAQLAGDGRRPVALVNPYGGAWRTKGYLPERPDTLADEVAGLVAEGYRVVLLPNGTAWGTRAAALRALGDMPPDVRAHLAIAPDPAEADPARRLSLTERRDLPYADRVVRLFKYFVARADLVVTIEGWMAHLAYALGRPFRLVLQAASYDAVWYPPTRGPGQRLAATLSPRGPRPSADVPGPDRPAPLPSRIQKPLFFAALAGLARLPAAPAVPILMRALESPDHETRAVAIRALSPFLPAEPPRGAVVAALREPDPTVRRAAAEALIRSGCDCSPELGLGYADQLAAHRDIARQDWPAVRRLGAAALPALFVAVDGRDEAIRREARRAAAWLLLQLGMVRAGAPAVERGGP